MLRSQYAPAERRRINAVGSGGRISADGIFYCILLIVLTLAAGESNSSGMFNTAQTQN